MRAFVVVVLAGCGDDTQAKPSDAPATPIDALVPDAWISIHNTSANIDVDVFNGGFTITARFTISRGTLPDDAQVTATFRGASLVLAKSSEGSFNSTQTYPNLKENEPLEVALTFGGETATAAIPLPLPFHVDSVTGSFCNQTINWSPTSTDPMSWNAFSGSPMGNTCPINLPADRTVPDTGSFTLTGCIVGSGPSCTTSFYLQRVRLGTVDGFLVGSDIHVIQKRGWTPP